MIVHPGRLFLSFGTFLLWSNFRTEELSSISYQLSSILLSCIMAKPMKQLNEAVKYLRKQYKETPQVGIVLGSGLGNFIEEVKVEKEISYNDIPNFPTSTVEGHKGKLVFGE